MTKAVSPRQPTDHHNWQALIEFTLPCESGSTDLATDLVVGTVQTLNWPAAHVEQLQLALGKALHSGLEWSQLNRSAALLVVRVFVSEAGRATQKIDRTGGEPVQRQQSIKAAQQAGRSPSGGWGFFLVQRQGDAPPVLTPGPHHLIELFLYEEGEPSRK